MGGAAPVMDGAVARMIIVGSVGGAKHNGVNVEN